MTQRIDYKKVGPDAFDAMLGIEACVHRSELQPSLLELVKTRVSQINGCAYCLDMHTRDARVAGETEQRLYLLSAWREAPVYSDRERAALAWAEAVTQISTSHVTDDLYVEVRRHFDEKELVDLTLAVIGINGWNRLAIAFRTELPPGTPGVGGHGVADRPAAVAKGN
jgi:AhpD family alkylhydroperoxidase